MVPGDADCRRAYCSSEERTGWLRERSDWGVKLSAAAVCDVTRRERARKVKEL
jgi:hypothetical protein